MAWPWFSLDRRDSKLLGVCSGIGRRLGIDPTWIRVAWVAVPLLTPVHFSTALLAYGVAGVIGWLRRKAAAEGSPARASVRGLRTRLDPTDLAGRNDSLARQIDALRDDGN